jgi:hypothetical protein
LCCSSTYSLIEIFLQSKYGNLHLVSCMINNYLRVVRKSDDDIWSNLCILLFTIQFFWRNCAGIFEQSMGTRKRVGIGLSYRAARLHRLAESIWNRFWGFIKFGLQSVQSLVNFTTIWQVFRDPPWLLIGVNNTEDWGVTTATYSLERGFR